LFRETLQAMDEALSDGRFREALSDGILWETLQKNDETLSDEMQWKSLYETI
jgi:hypothetical protein